MSECDHIPSITGDLIMPTLDGLVDYEFLLDLVGNGIEQKVRGSEYTAIIPPTFRAKAKNAQFFSQFPNFSKYLGDARIEYITSMFTPDMLFETIVNFADDDYTRQNVVYKPDWYWKGQLEHVNCVLAYQPMIMDEKVDLHVFMRSSDLWNAFPYDWYCHSAHLFFFSALHQAGQEARESPVCLQNVMEKAASLSDEAVGYIYYHTSNLHIRTEDIPKIAAWKMSQK